MRMVEAQSTALLTSINSYVCPSELPLGSNPVADFASGTTINCYSQSSYCLSAGTWNVIAYYSGPDCWQQDFGNGAFDDYGPTALATFTDGTSNTALAGEVCRFTNDGDTYQQFWTIYGFFGSVNGGANPSTRGAVGLAFQVPLPNQPFQPGDAVDPNPGSNPLPPGTNWPDTSDYKAWSTPALAPQYAKYGQWGFRSRHPGGVNMVMSDGSVRFFKNSIAQTVWMAIGTRNQGEVLSSDSY